MVEEGSRGRKKDGGGDTRLMYREPIRLYCEGDNRENAGSCRGEKDRCK